MDTRQLLLICAAAGGLASCGQLLEPKDKGLAEVRKIESRWNDALVLAQASNRLVQGPQVANLQAIKRDLDALEVSECLKEAKVTLNQYMTLSIDGFLKSMAGENSTADDANEKLKGYKPSRDKCAN